MNVAMYLAGNGGAEANGFGCFCVGALFFIGLGLFARSQQNNNHRR